MAGSSPRAWGTSGSNEVKPGKVRFIPTCVGNVWLLCKGSTRKTVHPHVRGERLKRP